MSAHESPSSDSASRAEQMIRCAKQAQEELLRARAARESGKEPEAREALALGEAYLLEGHVHRLAAMEAGEEPARLRLTDHETPVARRSSSWPTSARVAVAVCLIGLLGMFGLYVMRGTPAQSNEAAAVALTPDRTSLEVARVNEIEEPEEKLAEPEQIASDSSDETVKVSPPEQLVKLTSKDKDAVGVINAVAEPAESKSQDIISAAESPDNNLGEDAVEVATLADSAPAQQHENENTASEPVSTSAQIEPAQVIAPTTASQPITEAVAPQPNRIDDSVYLDYAERLIALDSLTVQDRWKASLEWLEQADAQELAQLGGELEWQLLALVDEVSAQGFGNTLTLLRAETATALDFAKQGSALSPQMRTRLALANTLAHSDQLILAQLAR